MVHKCLKTQKKCGVKYVCQFLGKNGARLLVTTAVVNVLLLYVYQKINCPPLINWTVSGSMETGCSRSHYVKTGFEAPFISVIFVFCIRWQWTPNFQCLLNLKVICDITTEDLGILFSNSHLFVGYDGVFLQFFLVLLPVTCRSLPEIHRCFFCLYWRSWPLDILVALIIWSSIEVG